MTSPVIRKPPRATINTAWGKGVYVKTVNDEELWAGDYSLKNGYAVTHHGDEHHVYRLVDYKQ